MVNLIIILRQDAALPVIENVAANDDVAAAGAGPVHNHVRPGGAVIPIAGVQPTIIIALNTIDRVALNDDVGGAFEVDGVFFLIADDVVADDRAAIGVGIDGAGRQIVVALELNAILDEAAVNHVVLNEGILHRPLAGADVDIAARGVANVVAADGRVLGDAADHDAQPGQTRNVIILDRGVLGTDDHDAILDAAAEGRRALGLDRAVSNHVVLGAGVVDVDQFRPRRHSLRVDVAQGESIDDDVTSRAAGTVEGDANGDDTVLADFASDRYRFTLVLLVRDRGSRRSRLVRFNDLVVRPGPDIDRISRPKCGVGFADRRPRRRG